MRRIIYQSIAAPDVDRAELFRLVYQARVANDAKGLCGFLMFVDQRFLQVLEGPPWELFGTFGKIRTDLRHSNVQLIDERSIAAPIFGRWRMRCFEEGDVAGALNAITAEAGGALPRVVDEAVLAFFGCEKARANQMRMHAI